jgi:uncharacterized protein YijF (DUF1287 family)
MTGRSPKSAPTGLSWGEDMSCIRRAIKTTDANVRLWLNHRITVAMTHKSLSRRSLLAGLAVLPFGISRAAARGVEPNAEKLIAAAESQIGVTRIYDAAYVRIPFPGGDVPAERGVCTDVVVRAYRQAFGYDLQAKLNADMKANFSAYPKRWGLSGPDSNIDHRRVPNLQVFFARQKLELPKPATSSM